MMLCRYQGIGDARYRKGMGLVELIIVLVLSIGALGVMLQVLSSNKSNTLIQESMGRMQENARIAMELLVEDIRMAGFMGEIQEYWNIEEAASPQALGTVSGECFTASATGGTSGFRWVAPFISVGSDPIFIPPKLYGVDDMTTSTIAPFGGCLQAHGFTPGTDVLSVHYVGPQAGPDNTGSVISGNVYLRANLYNAVLFRSSGGTLPIPASGNWSSGPNTRVFPLSAALYFLRACSNAGVNQVCGDSGDDNIPVLARKVLRANGTVATEVVAEGVVGFQVRYGVDTDTGAGDGIADQYVDAGSALLPTITSNANWAAWAKIRTVRVWLLMRSEESFAGHQDKNASYTLADTTIATTAGYRYQLFTNTIAVRNVSGDD